MAYFADLYENISYPVASAEAPGLYNAQLGAIHALASHFTVESQPALVSMPTGSGKTAVLMMLPFLLRSSRVLVITPSNLVRGQIAEEFRTLSTLRAAGVLPDNVPMPTVLELRQRITTVTDWESLRAYDVVVSTPNCTSPGYSDIPNPPADLFDLLLIDEAHHTPARTWTAILTALAHIRRALFSATPFRRDRAEIPGRFVYNYPVSRAYQDGIFGKISFVEVQPTAKETNDIAIAKKAAAVFAADKAAGLSHCLMVRTDKKARADSLAKIYEAHTPLRLRVIHSSLTNRTIQRVLAALAKGELDGVICVNMMGEGFNFPRLKIAAIHSPHKSLEVTLQFVGRFARTNAPDIGAAKFIAVLNEIEFERQRLFDEGAVWEEIIPDLTYGRIAAEQHVREALEQFANPEADDLDLADLSLYSLHPRSHVKIYSVHGPIDLRTIAFPDLGVEVAYRNPSADGTALILVTRELATPKWSTGDTLIDRRYGLLVLFYDAATTLFFINSSHSADGTYARIVEAVTGRPTESIPTALVRRVIRDMTNQRIFNVGMRNILAANTRESYKIVAAADAQIDPADARRYRQGHVFLSGEEAGARTTIGYSSGGKVWSSSTHQLPSLLAWCQALGKRIRSVDPVVTHSSLDYLDAGRVVDTIPENLIYVQWNKDAFDYSPPTQIEYTKSDGDFFRGHILDLDLTLDRGSTTRDRIRVVVSGDGLELPLDFTITEFFVAADASIARPVVIKGNRSLDIIDYLNEHYLDFFSADGSLFFGNELFETKQPPRPIADDQLTTWDWNDSNIEDEVGVGGAKLSVHEKVRSVLLAGDAPLILYDHGSGEIADFFTITETPLATIFCLYHCKASSAPAAGARVDDVYDVCGQAQKCVAWASLSRLESRLRRRAELRFVRGDQILLWELLDRAKERLSRFEIKLVQPGISKAALSDAMAECLGATHSHLVAVGIAALEVITSA